MRINTHFEYINFCNFKVRMLFYTELMKTNPLLVCQSLSLVTLKPLVAPECSKVATALALQVILNHSIPLVFASNCYLVFW